MEYKDILGKFDAILERSELNDEDKISLRLWLGKAYIQGVYDQLDDKVVWD